VFSTFGLAGDFSRLSTGGKQLADVFERARTRLVGSRPASSVERAHGAIEAQQPRRLKSGFREQSFCYASKAPSLEHAKIDAHRSSGEVAMRKRSGSSARGGRAAASVRRTRRKIDFSDIPDSSAEQLKTMRRVGRPPLGDEPRQLIAIRVDAGVLDQFRKEARRRRVGYQTLINEVLARHVRKDVA
jgi:uncharacterized protein (DUF4415 family)